MISYQLKLSLDNIVRSVLRSDGWLIPFSINNTDYQQFKKDLQSGATLQDADGNTMTADQITTFLGTLK